MSVTELTPESSAKSEKKFLVVDADAHIDPPHEAWADYLPEKFKERAPRIEEGEDCDYVVFEGNRRPILMINNQAGRKGKDFKMVGKRSEMRNVRDPKIRLEDMDTDGIDSAVLFGGGPLGTSDSEFYIESYRAYNRWLWDFCGTDRKRLTGVAYMPMRDVDETIGMIKEVAKLGFKTINIPAFPQAKDALSTSAQVGKMASGQIAALTGDPSSSTPYWSACFDPLWQTICDNDLNVTFHLGGRIPRFGQKEYFLADLVMSKVAMAEPVAMAIYGGIFDRFPNMKWAIVESGVGWMAWMAEYMDRTWEKQRYWTNSDIKERPSFYMDRNIFGSFINDRTGILNRALPGGKNIMWSSDYPHSETTFPNSHQVIARDFEGVPDAEVQEIVGGRAKAFYKVDI
ncbi:amidohydrolase family protein [Novosphingobium pentaromativorans]|uniref:Amidohydrolase-related domain-containing protein n=1 Tax=Novosphingobium pentaromativorans US6-1 TaxID=1088721 RepID=G6E881_9SPHN|nr:amidohydrolase family protein [Novosphingobium pentaromativorans]AIT81425.1 hydrolase [Novosphingobium pentaromativorans US6-1]EHJ62421.1 hypothetical protein NSU_0552 [Novosphingobium pentaromativorans US6-1]